jgi:hypothetical protein
MSCSTTVSCGQRPCASRLRSPRRTPSTRAAGEQESTRLAYSTATGPCAQIPSMTSAAITGQSGHQTAIVRAAALRSLTPTPAAAADGSSPVPPPV